MHRPFGNIDHCRSASEHFQCTKIPFEQLDLKTRGAVGKPQNKFAKPFWRVAFFPAASAEIDAGVEIPSDQHDPAFGVHHCRLNDFKIRCGIDNGVRPARFRVTPDAIAFGFFCAHMRVVERVWVPVKQQICGPIKMLLHTLKKFV